MTTSTSVQYNKVNDPDGRTSIFCKQGRKLLTRIDTASIEQLASISGGQWSWCRGCHMEHYIQWQDITR